MGYRRRFVLLALLAGCTVAVISFFGGTVGALITGRAPFSLFAVATPHVELPAARPFSSLTLTNTLLASWLTSGVIIAVFLRATRNLQLIPGGLQNLVEFICEFASGFIEVMVGPEQERRFFPLVMTVFLFVLGNAWLGLLPGFDSIRLNGVSVLRCANTDMNVTLMLALVCVVMVEYWGWSTGRLSYLGSFFDLTHLRAGIGSIRARNLNAGMKELAFGQVFIFAGLVELLGHVVRIFSFSFRLFGNMTAGVILTGMAIFLVPLVLPAVFYGLEVLFGLVQAVIFAGLTAVFGYAAVSGAEH